MMIIYGKEKEILKAQKRSLAAWINTTLGSTVVDADNLIEKLSTGTILCKLATCIQKKVDEAYVPNLERQSKLKYWESAKKDSFFARDNAEVFIRWCKNFGVRDAVLFESDGLVLRTQPRTVVLCLLELARLASRYGILLPPPIQLPKTSSLLEDDSECSEDEFFFATTLESPTTITSKYHRWDSGCSSDARSPSFGSSSPGHSKTSSPNLKRSSSIPKRTEKNVVVVVRSCTDDFISQEEFKNRCSSPRISSPSLRRSSPSVRADTVSSRLKMNSPLSRSSSTALIPRATVENKIRDTNIGISIRTREKSTFLDKRVLEVARELKKDESKIRRISEGHYVFGDKNVFVRIVRGNNVVVRLGGGWDTLEHFLSTMDFDKKYATQRFPDKRKNRRKFYSFRNITPYMTL